MKNFSAFRFAVAAGFFSLRMPLWSQSALLRAFPECGHSPNYSLNSTVRTAIQSQGWAS